MKRATQQRIRERLARGMKVHRGLAPPRYGEPFASDPGDFGRGIYYTTSKARARCYGEVVTTTLRLTNPLIVPVEQAYALADDCFGTIRGETSERMRAASALTRYLKWIGFDGLVAIHDQRGELEIVDYTHPPL